jgi:hypothetical protein
MAFKLTEQTLRQYEKMRREPDTGTGHGIYGEATPRYSGGQIISWVPSKRELADPNYPQPTSQDDHAWEKEIEDEWAASS